MGLPTPFNPYTPIPNNPFYSALSYYVQGVTGPLVIGAGLSVSYASGTLNTSGGGGGGAVSQIVAGTGITVSPAGGTGNVVVNNAGVVGLVAGTGISISAGLGGIYTINSSVPAGTVTVVNSGTGLLGGPITTSGTLSLNPACVVDPTDYTAKGTILAGTGPSAYAALPVGANGLVLTACSTAATGLCWMSASASDIPCAAITGKGALITGTAPSTTFSLPAGSDGQVLTACAACGPGLYWSAPTAVVPDATPSVEGIVYGCTDATTSFTTALGGGALAVATGPGNVGIGFDAGNDVTSGQANVLLGSGAGCAITSGGNNIVAGFLSLSSLTTGCSNVVVGNSAGTALTTECGNVILGGHPGFPTECRQIILSDGFGTLRLQVNECGALSPDGATYGTAGQVLCSGGPTNTWGWTSAAGSPDATSVAAGILKGCTNNTLCNVFFGCCAGPGPTATGNGNTAVGYQAGATITNGNVNTLVGCGAGLSITGGSWNVLIAHNAGDSITTGGCNIAIGGAAGSSIVSTCENVLIGDLAGTALTGSQNVALGTRALCAVSSGNANTALGNYSGQKITTGCNNVAIGPSSMGGSSVGITGCNNVAIGNSTLGAVTTASSNTVVGSGSGSSITTNGCNVLIGGLNNTGFAFNTIVGNNFSGTGNCQVFIGFAGTAGTYACFAQGSPGWNFPSDARRKDNIEDLGEGLALVEKLQPRTFMVKGATKDDEKTPSFGLVAQEVADAIKGTVLEGRGLVNGDEEGGYGIVYSSLVAVLINAVKELSAEVKALKKAK